MKLLDCISQMWATLREMEEYDPVEALRIRVAALESEVKELREGRRLLDIVADSADGPPS